MKPTNSRSLAIAAIVAIVIIFVVYKVMNHSASSVIANDPNPCVNPTIAKTILARVSDIQRANGGKLTAIDMQDVTTLSRSNDGSELECHATFVMSNGDHTPGNFSLKPNVAGQPVMQFTPDGAATTNPATP